MRKIVYFLSVFIVIPIILSGKNNDHFKVEKVDFDEIKREVKNPVSRFYYDKLFDKYGSLDTTMTVEDYRYLYYGYVFNENYNPYIMPKNNSEIESLYYNKNLKPRECDTIIKYAKAALKENIFDLRQIQFMIIALREKGKLNLAAIWQFRLKRLIAAILSSGTGTEKEPWMVINPAHEYNIINFMNHYVVEHKTIGDSVDFLKVDESKIRKNAPKGYYFDISPIVNAASH